MKRYDSYKPSGISWIGEIPSHWEKSQLRKFLTLVSEKGHGDKQLLSVTREYGVIVRDVESKEENHNFIPDDLSNYKLVKVGQLAINKMKSWQGSYAVSNYEGIVSPAYYICDLNFDNKEFFSWAIRSKAYVPFFTQMSKGIRVDQWDLSTNALKEIPFFVPSADEQRQIVEYLSTKTSQIDAQQRERERELLLLDELKQAEIANVVTHGLNPDASFKSVHTLLGEEIPSDWNLIRMRNLVKEQNELVGDRKTFPLLSLTKGGVILRDVESGKGKFPKDFQKYKVVVPNDIIFCLFDIDETPRTVGLSSHHGMITGAYDVFAINEKIVNKEFLYYYFLAVDNFKALRPYYTGLRKVVQGPIFLSLQIPVPPIEEQEAIVEYIRKKNSAIDDMIANLRAEIDFLTEYKQRLIADAVTGQIKID